MGGGAAQTELETCEVDDRPVAEGEGAFLGALSGLRNVRERDCWARANITGDNGNGKERNKLNMEVKARVTKGSAKEKGEK